MADGKDKKTAFLTGATGFVGINVARQLVDDGWHVVALRRETSDHTWLDRLPVEQVLGDVLQAETLTRALPPRVDAVFHVAADLNTWSRHNAAQTAVNVDGTRNLVTAALEREAKRFIVTSSISAYGPQSEPVSESTVSTAAGSWVNYERSKWLAEEEARRGQRQGLFTVIINPCAIFGPWDTHSWARMIYLIRDGKIQGIPPGTVTVNHVSEVARAHLAAAERGRSGENYLLNGESMSFESLFRMIADQLGVELKARVMPAPLLKLAARAGTALAVFTGKPPGITPEMAALMCAHTRCDSDKAERELGYRRVPIRTCVEDSIAWLRAEGLLDA